MLVLMLCQGWALADDNNRPIVIALSAEFCVKDSVPAESIKKGILLAYDLTHLLAMAINQAGKADRSAIRNALKPLGPYQGQVRHYKQPFTKLRHETLDQHQLFMARFDKFGNVLKIKE